MAEKEYVVDEISASESWRLFRIMAEFVEGVEALSHIQPFPVILVGRAFWMPLLAWIEDNLLARGLISIGDRNILRLAETAEDVLCILKNTRLPETPEGVGA